MRNDNEPKFRLRERNKKNRIQLTISYKTHHELAELATLMDSSMSGIVEKLIRAMYRNDVTQFVNLSNTFWHEKNIDKILDK